ncbi:M23 family metallopeptidase [Donghicola tyrosinivorans]|uniref:Murein DD-endopeptidase MepM/ murein hydrolase activator NlpD n=1 Tax=Donghicola tyrosinivorans TaxID=1652492 RepID=A0A2T0X596_9RHOB|nr:M23 family metallopeptidase [Donghicola tyrosinivorans]PRY94106.1 murein DD-endopeptidase MepM/ murein hydrolase activator NlpD [Donghicola tyrosinivorans]
MKTRVMRGINALLENKVPERRVFLRSDNETRFIRLSPLTQITVALGSAGVLAWAAIATSILLMDSIGSGNVRAQAQREQQTYEMRLNGMAAERDKRADEAIAAQERFNKALEQISVMQTQLLASEDRRRELETGLNVVQNTLRRTMKERDNARGDAQTLQASLSSEGGSAAALPTSSEVIGTVDALSLALTETAAERDNMAQEAQVALRQADEIAMQLQLLRDQNDQVFRQLEDAMTVSVEPLNKMFRAAGMDPDTIIKQVRRTYSGQGGPLTPLSFATEETEETAEVLRANRLLEQMDRLNIYRIAAEKAPFAIPVKNAYRFTSPYGTRSDPKNGSRRMHFGVDFAAAYGTPLYATGDGVVIHAGWSSGYGRLVKIQHDFGIETRFAHLSKINVTKGQRVSRGDRIGDMGASGRVTGTHLHYEVRVGGKPVNPMVYIKAANDVF